jgi:3-oxo-5-alpha-steroid 4-dehydrogenase 1
LPALAFLVWTLANLIPRALDHHKWYRSEFPDYPSKRKAVLPFLV